MKKIIITPNEVAALFGKSESYGRRVIRELKKKLGRTKKQFITYREFAEDYGFTVEEVLEGIN